MFQPNLSLIESYWNVWGSVKNSLKPEKCEFKKSSVEYLGVVISHNSVNMDPVKVAGVSKWPTSTNRKEVQSFLRFVNFYRRLIEGFSQIAQPLFNLTKTETVFKWTEEENSAFNTLRTQITSSPILTLLDSSKPYHVEADSSYFATGAVIIQKMINGTLSPSCLNPYLQLKETMRYMKRRCWPSSKL